MSSSSATTDANKHFARALAASATSSIFERSFAKYLDSADSLSAFRGRFSLPTRRDVGATPTKEKDDDLPAIYLCGNSLGLMPSEAPKLMSQEMQVWAQKAVLGHFDHPHERPWKYIADFTLRTMSTIVGANPSEVACMGTLTANLHTLLSTFYKPTSTRYKILFEKNAFPSDTYAFASRAQLAGLNPAEALIQLAPKEGDFVLHTSDILEAIRVHGDSIAVIIFSGVQYYTGQLFDMQAITKAGHAKGCLVGWDLAHAVGNAPLKLHDWDVDFAAWCTYKYLNSGPGAIAGLFVHERHADPSSLARQSGWWGHNPETRFDMPAIFEATPGAAGFQMSNPSVFSVMPLMASLQVWQAALNSSSNEGFSRIRAKSELLTAYLEKLLTATNHYVPPSEAHHYQGPAAFTIITPSAAKERGAQLSLLFLPSGHGVMQQVQELLQSKGIVADERKPDVIRLAPVPFYNTFLEVREAAMAVFQCLQQIRSGLEGEAAPALGS